MMKNKTGTVLTCVALVLSACNCLDAEDPGNLVPKTVAEDPDLPRIEVAGTLLHAEAFGDPRSPIVFVLHSGPGGDYRSLLPLRALADDGYRVVFWDQRGAGLSQRHDASAYSVAGYLEDLRLVIEHYTVTPGQPFVFIGQSWGAMYATLFIDTYGDYGGRVRGAVYTEPGGFKKSQLDAFLKRFMAATDLTGEQFNDATWSRQFLSAADHARADYLTLVMSYGGPPAEHHDPNNKAPSWRPGAVVQAKLLSLVKDDFDWTTNLSRFDRKVLFIRGDLNEAATLEHQQELAADYPISELITIPNVGHKLIWERTDEYLAHARDYFRQIGFVGAQP